MVPASSVQFNPLGCRRCPASPEPLIRTTHLLLQVQRIHGKRHVQRLLNGSVAEQGDMYVRARRSVGPAGDAYEREADAVAAVVARRIRSSCGLTDLPPCR
jgi:hypothetical protein